MSNEIKSKGRSARSVRQLAMDSVLAAMCAVLGYLALDFGNLKITFESFPVLIGALLFGPIDGLLIGSAGEFLYQVLLYGLDITTPLWILPYLILGVWAGAASQKHHYKLSNKQLTLLVFGTEYAVTALNTGVLVIHSKLFGYYEPTFITGALALRLVLTAAKAAAFAFILPPVLKALRKNIR